MATVKGKAPNLKARKLKLKTGDNLSYTFPYAPKAISYEGGNRNWFESARPGRMSQYIYGSVQGRTASFQAEIASPKRESITASLNSLLKLSRTKSYVIMEYTASEAGVWIFSSLTVDIVKRNANHNPYHATVTVVLKEVDIKIPNKSPVSGGKQTTGKTATTSTVKKTTSKAVKTYTVKKGDTLWAISVKYFGTGSKWTQIADKNKIRNAKSLKVGQVLRIP